MKGQIIANQDKKSKIAKKSGKLTVVEWFGGTPNGPEDHVMLQYPTPSVRSKVKTMCIVRQIAEVIRRSIIASLKVAKTGKEESEF